MPLPLLQKPYFSVMITKLCVATALEELMYRLVNPLRRFMVWRREVRKANALFRAFRAAMVNLVKEVTVLCPSSTNKQLDMAQAFGYIATGACA